MILSNRAAARAVPGCQDMDQLVAHRRSVGNFAAASKETVKAWIVFGHERLDILLPSYLFYPDYQLPKAAKGTAVGTKQATVKTS